MVVGIGLIGTVSATVAAWFVSRKQQARDDQVKADRAAARKQRRLRLRRAVSMSRFRQPTHRGAGFRGCSGPRRGASTAGDAHRHRHETVSDTPVQVGLDDEMVDEVTSLSDTVAALTTQIQALTAQQEALRASIDRLVDQRAG